MHVLLVEPEYYSTYPPLGLLKLSAYHKLKGDTTELVKGCKFPRKKPNRVYVTSLWTWAWKPVWQAVKFYKRFGVEVWLGGLYASLLPDHAAKSGADRIYTGLFREAEDLMPDYSLVPEWDGSIVFSSRGCNGCCPFCAVPLLEGRLNSAKRSIRHLVYPGHTRIIFWDNNILQNPYWREIFEELKDLDLKVDFNQGLDASLITEEVAFRLAELRLDSGKGIKVRLAYDTKEKGSSVRRAIEYLNKAGIRGRAIMVYTLFNFRDTPQDFFERVRDVLNWGAVCYPMWYQPVTLPFALEKNSYVSPNWTREELEQVQRARRVMGYMGAFPPHSGLLKKFNEARNFQEAFRLRPLRTKNRTKKDGRK